MLAGDKVKFTVRFRGREIFHPDIGREMLEQMAEELRDVATVEQRPLMEGRALSLMLAPSAKLAAASAKPKPPREPRAPSLTAEQFAARASASAERAGCGH